ncbi:MAG: 1-acyl-sn-glycerol-3-phosphate acyltransferase [Deltaproteobacteria bacterium]|nr:1-acyl-sn-glycerol-3-phosphate acyltransferase [Deltaproteobacteria bacterium]
MFYFVRFCLIALYTVFWGALATVVAPFSGEAIVWIGRNWIRWIFATSRIEVQVEGLEHVRATPCAVYMSNHQSVLDIGAIIETLPVSWRFVAKKELTYVPFFGWALALSDQIVIDRGNRRRSVESLRRAAERVRAGANVIIFPEGTRSPDGKLQPFKSGGFHLAVDAGVPVIPVTVSGSAALTPKHSLKVLSGPVKVVYGAPIPIAGPHARDREALKQRVAAAIEAGYDAELQRNR